MSRAYCQRAISSVCCVGGAVANPLFLVRAASIVPSCETAVTEIDTPSTRRQRRERELKIPVFSINSVVGTSKKDALFVVFLETGQLFVSRALPQRRRSCTFQRAAISLGKVAATPAAHPTPPRPPFSDFSPSLTYAAHRPCVRVRGSAPCHVHSDQ